MTEFKGREERAKCYEARDAYLACCDEQPESKDCKSTCKDLLEKFEKTCGHKWTEHFIRKNQYMKFKEKLQTDGIRAVDAQKYNSK